MNNIKLILLGLAYTFITFNTFAQNAIHRPDGSSDVRWLEGTWIGNVYKPSTKTHWTIKLVYSIHYDTDHGGYYYGRGKIEYPSLGCSGVFFFRQDKDREYLSFGPIKIVNNPNNVCLEETWALVGRINDEIINLSYFETKSSEESSVPDAFAILRRDE